MILNITVTIKRPTLPWHHQTSTGFVANAPIRIRAAVSQGPATFVRHPTQSARWWWFLSPLPRCWQSLCAFASQHAPPVLPLTCPLQMRRRLWHPHRRQSLCALANQCATPVLSLICLIQIADKTLKGYLPHQKVRVLLVFTDLTKDDSPRTPTMGFLHAPKGSG